MLEKSEVLRALKAELKFLKDGGYGHSARAAWRQALIFEDSPSCPNVDDTSRPHPCGECWLTQFVPANLQDHDRPCRLIPLDAEGRTLEHLYHYGTQLEMEEIFGRWLLHKIRQAEGAGVA